MAMYGRIQRATAHPRPLTQQEDDRHLIRRELEELEPARRGDQREENRRQDGVSYR